MKSDTHLFFWENVKKSVHLKLKTMSIACKFHVFDLMLTLYISYKKVRYHFYKHVRYYFYVKQQTSLYYNILLIRLK